MYQNHAHRARQHELEERYVTHPIGCINISPSSISEPKHNIHANSLNLKVIETIVSPVFWLMGSSHRDCQC